ncbi:MAG: TrkA C-terminal domain-containing protein [Methanospirillum sp.]|nr:TrkA C-terminal domain-containing protein [Methanospirillum sp.]
MEETTLQAVQRAMPGHGRARIHEKLLSILEIEDKTDVEVSTEAGSTLTLTIFADELVDDGTIRISGEDLKKLGIPDGGKVLVRRKKPLEEQIRAGAESAAGQIKTGAHEIGVKVSDTADRIHKEASDTAGHIGDKAKELSDKIRDETRPIGEKVTQAAKSSAEAIREKIPIGRFSPDVEKALSGLQTEEAKKIRSLLTGAEGSNAAITVKVSSGRSVGNLTIPPEAHLAGIQREDLLLDGKPDMVLKEGDIVYITGPSEAIGFMTRMLEG